MKALKILLLIGLLPIHLFAENIDTAAVKVSFETAKLHLENMLSGKEKLSYEEAIFQIENAWWGGKLDYSSFKKSLDYQEGNIRGIVRSQTNNARMNSQRDLLTTADQKREMYVKALSNYAIYRYMTKLSIIERSGGLTYHNPFAYSTSDPLGTIDWTNTHVTHLINKGSGNCFALASFFRIFAERLNSDAQLCTAPGHIYIRHADDKGAKFNVELASRSFPGTGTIETITYTPTEATKNGIALRELNIRQSVALCLVYLAKGYEYKLGINDDDFILSCAEAALRCDGYNLNAMLLKAEVLEKRLLKQGTDLATLQRQQKFTEYQDWINKIFQLGYREMPFEMKNLLIKGWAKDTLIQLASEDHTPSRLKHPTLRDTRYAGLSWGLFDEEIRTKRLERYSNTVFDTKEKKIVAFLKDDILYNQYNFDPVAFAWNVDPLAHKFPSMSPYSAMGNNPIRNIDPDGRAFVVADRAQRTTVLGYLQEQVGAGIFSFNRRGNLTVDRRAYNAARENMSENQRAMADGMIQLVNSDRIVEARIYDNQNINFVRNPTVTERTTTYDPDLGRNVTTTNSRPMYSGQGVMIPNLGQEAITVFIQGDDRAFILFDQNAANTGTFNAEGGGQTNPCASCIFMHEALDHGLDYINTGDVVEPNGATPQDNVQNHNRALENVGSPTRTGTDHR